MALQNQTYANSGNGYYIQGADPFNPSTNTALYGPVEILFTSTIAGQFYGDLNQTPSTFTISENNASLSTINSLVMDPVVPKTTMNIYNYATNGEPVIQQWSHTSSIVNGVFKVGNKQLNDEPNALVFSNLANATEITQGAGGMVTVIDGVNTRTVFANNADRQNNVTINQAGGAPAVTVKDNANNSIVTQPTVQTFNRTGITYGRTGVNSAIPNQYFMSARTQMDFVTDETNVAPTVLSLKQNGTANFISTVFAPTVSTTSVVSVDANLDNISTLRINQKGPSGQPIFVGGSVQIRRTAGPNGGAGINFLMSPRVRIEDNGLPNPKVYYPTPDNEAQLVQGVLAGTAGGPPFAPLSAVNSLEIIASSALTEGGVQFYNAKSGNVPEWMGGFLKNPKSFNVAPGYVANLAGNVSTPFVFASASISTPIVRASNFIETGPGSYISTPVLNATLSTITTNAIAGFSHKTPNSVITNNNSATPPPGPYPTAYGNFQGQFMYNTLRGSYGAPNTAFESLEVVNVAGGPQTGGIQFYTSDNSNPANPKWMGGFLQNNVGAGQSEFRLASTITASMPQLVNVSTINTLPISAFGVPVGTMLNWAGQLPSSVPPGYLLCDGSYVNIAGIYNNLFTVIGSWGPTIGGQFRLPDSRGKTLMGSLTLPVNFGPAGAYTITANFVSLVTVTLPASFGGGTRVCLYITNPQGQIFPGMRIVTAGFDTIVSVVGFINSDGLYGNTSPVPPAGVNNRATIVIFTNNQSYSGPTNIPIQFQTNNNEAINYPYIQDSWNPLVPGFGVGNYAQLQQEYEVGGHNHVQQQGGVQGTAGLGPRSGDPNVGGPNTNINNGLFSYVDPTTSQTVSGPFAMFNLPYNIATFQIIKF
jgi:hypothetical protein